MAGLSVESIPCCGKAKNLTKNFHSLTRFIDALLAPTPTRKRGNDLRHRSTALERLLTHASDWQKGE